MSYLQPDYVSPYAIFCNEMYPKACDSLIVEKYKEKWSKHMSVEEKKHYEDMADMSNKRSKSMWMFRTKYFSRQLITYVKTTYKITDNFISYFEYAHVDIPLGNTQIVKKYIQFLEVFKRSLLIIIYESDARFHIFGMNTAKKLKKYLQLEENIINEIYAMLTAPYKEWFAWFIIRVEYHFELCLTELADWEYHINKYIKDKQIIYESLDINAYKKILYELEWLDYFIIIAIINEKFMDIYSMMST
jgi:hypothetical protein